MRATVLATPFTSGGEGLRDNGDSHGLPCSVEVTDAGPTPVIVTKPRRMSVMARKRQAPSALIGAEEGGGRHGPPVAFRPAARVPAPEYGRAVQHCPNAAGECGRRFVDADTGAVNNLEQ